MILTAFTVEMDDLKTLALREIKIEMNEEDEPGQVNVLSCFPMCKIDCSNFTAGLLSVATQQCSLKERFDEYLQVKRQKLKG